MQVFCRGHFVAAYFLSHLSSWTIATLSAERAFAIAGTMAGNGSRRNTVICFVILATLLLAVDSHLMKFVRFEVFSYYERRPECGELFSFENFSSIATLVSAKDSSPFQSISTSMSTLLEPLPSDSEAFMASPTESTATSKDEQFEVVDDECHEKVEHRFCWLELGSLHRQLWQWVDALLFALAPFIVIIVSNVIVARSIIKADKFRSSFLPAPNFETGTRFVRRKPIGNDKSTLRRISEEGCTRNLMFSRGVEAFEIQGNDKRESKKRFLSKRAKSSTIMLLVVSLTFLVTTTPLIIYIIVVNLTNDVSMEFTGCLCFLFYYVGNCTNFLQYCLSGSKFRKSLKMVLKLAKIRVQAAWQMFHNICCLRSFNQVPRQQNIVTPTRKNTEKFSLTFQDASQKIRWTCRSRIIPSALFYEALHLRKIRLANLELTLHYYWSLLLLLLLLIIIISY